MSLVLRVQPVIAVALVAWVFNVIWEFAQMPQYSAAANAAGHAWACLRASVFDAAYVTLVYIVLAALHRSIDWVRRVTVADVTAVVASGLLVAAVIEWRALADGRWSYAPRMPLVWGVGLTPLLQLTVTSLVTFAAVRWWLRRSA